MVTVGCGAGTLTVTVGAALGPCCRRVAPTRAGTAIVAISANPMAPAIASKALDRSRFRSFLR
jgi:precorrin-6B methylase 2